LARDHEVELLIIDDQPPDEDAINTLESMFSDVTTFSYPSYRFYLNAGRGVISRLPLQAYYFWFRRVNRWIDAQINRYDLLFCNHLRTAKYACERAVPKVLDLVDAMSRTYQRMSSELSGIQKAIYTVERRRMPKYERRMIDEFDISFITSDVDKQHIEEGWRTAPDLTVVPNGVDKELLKRGPAFSERSFTIVFLGKMDYFPNEDAVCHFAENIFPFVRDAVPNAIFKIVGMNPTERVSQLAHRPEVEVTGFVDEPTVHTADADIVVAPLRYGAGIQNKILEAMALGKAVVTTPLGAEGIDGVSESHFVVADSANEFADATIELLQNENRRLDIGREAHTLISRQYTWDAVAEPLLQPVRELLDG
jgi:sugar transferase (PEP-CTERM/EpsH1 system associated)